MRSTACDVTPAVCEIAKLILRARGLGISPSNAAALLTSSFDRTTAAISVVSASSSFNSSFSPSCLMRHQGSSNNRTPASRRRRRAVSFVIFPSSRRSADPNPLGLLIQCCPIHGQILRSPRQGLHDQSRANRQFHGLSPPAKMLEVLPNQFWPFLHQKTNHNGRFGARTHG